MAVMTVTARCDGGDGPEEWRCGENCTRGTSAAVIAIAMANQVESSRCTHGGEGEPKIAIAIASYCN